jgi:hypothetical protein
MPQRPLSPLLSPLTILFNTQDIFRTINEEEDVSITTRGGTTNRDVLGATLTKSQYSYTHIL